MDLLKRLQSAADQGRNLLLDRELRIGITGLSRGGKTALITSLVNTVCSFGDEDAASRLSRFPSFEKAGICYGGLAPARDLSVAAFPYRNAMDSLTSEPPAWPEPTDGVSEIRLEIRYRDDRWLRKGQMRSLYLDIWDYPGEWLLDLMLLDLSYEEFSAAIAAQATKVRQVADASIWQSAVSELDPLSPPDERALAAAVEAYTAWLRACKEAGLAMVVPGRFVLPGNLAGALLLQFVPWTGVPVSDHDAGSLYACLKTRYNAYREQVVRKFYRECFSKIDRQIVIIDCLQALMGGKETFMDINDTFQVLLENFNYGASSWWNRLFSPKIDKVVFAASKCDRITYDEHHHLLSLLKSMVSLAVGQARADGAHCEYLVLSAIRAANCVTAEIRGQKHQVLVSADPSVKPFYPGSVPEIWTRENMDFFQKYFRFVKLPPPALSPGQPIPELNLDVLLEYLIGDKL
ncbi:MAG: YcjX family protein [Succinivibrionaceae bacterium]|nr:YcjX family protein [Succinivibrionaceae bacterium]